MGTSWGSLQNSGAKHVGNKMPKQFKNFSICLGNMLAKRKLLKTQQKPLYISLAVASAYLSKLPRDDIIFNSWDYLLCLNGIILNNTPEKVKHEKINLRRSLCFGFFVCPCYSRKQYSMPEKPGAQNIAVCENQGKQHKFSIHWKPIIISFWKKSNWGWYRKEKKIEIQVLTKHFTYYKIRYKSFKKINVIS